MLTKQLKSLQHPIVKKVVKLRKDKDFRADQRQVLVLGEKMVKELGRNFYPAMLFTTQETAIQCKKTFLVTDEIMQKISGVKNPENIAAIFSLPMEKQITDQKYLLVLDQIADPGNLGTLFRTALAMGFEAVVLLNNCVDPFNDKSVRAAKGALFYLPFCKMDKSAFLQMVQRKKIFTYIADMWGLDIQTVTFTPPLALILSNEANGTGIWPEEFHKISIPMQDNVESLNVAASGAIIMYKIKK